MIDYKKHRYRLGAVKSYPEMNYEWRRAREEASHKLYGDAEELLDKAEKWDKVNEGLEVDGIHTSKGILGELYELREKVEERDKLADIIKTALNVCVGDKSFGDMDALSTKLASVFSKTLLSEDGKGLICNSEDPAPVEEGKK